MTPRLQVTVIEERGLHYQAEFDGPVTLGRPRDREEALFTRKKVPTGWRWVIAAREEVIVGRNQLTITPRGGNRAVISNGSDRNPIRFPDRAALPPGASCELLLPVLVILGPNKSVRIQEVTDLESVSTAPPSVQPADSSSEDEGKQRPDEPPRPSPERYAILQTLASGAVSIISVAQDRELKRVVALKELRPDLVGHATFIARFSREIDITAQFDHPGVLPVYGSGRWADGRPYFAMRLVRNETLAAAIARCHQMLPTDPAGFFNRTFGRLLRRFLAACRVVEYAHGRSVVHRDLKPTNIMVGQHDDTYVIDWGLANVVGGVDGGTSPPDAIVLSAGALDTRHGATMGTYGYASPEQVGAGGPVGPASDVYSLGATLYHLLTGRPPFVPASGDSALESRSGDFPRPRRLNPAIPPHLEAICLRAMDSDIGARYPNAAALSAVVARWLARPV